MRYIITSILLLNFPDTSNITLREFLTYVFWIIYQAFLTPLNCRRFLLDGVLGGPRNHAGDSGEEQNPEMPYYKIWHNFEGLVIYLCVTILPCIILNFFCDKLGLNDENVSLVSKHVGIFNRVYIFLIRPATV
jgi:hypothetical protein